MLVDVLQNLQDGQSALFHVVVKGQKQVDLVEKMLEQGANPNLQDTVSSYMQAAGLGELLWLHAP